MSDKNSKPDFSVNEHDSDGDLVEVGVYLHFGATRILIGDIDDFSNLIGNLRRIESEIKETWDREQDKL